MGIGWRGRRERARNRKAVEAYFAMHGPARADLFAPDALRVAPFCADTTEVPGKRGRETLREDMARSVHVFPTWAFEDLAVFETQDPGAFWVDVAGRGTFATGGTTVPAYNKYVFFFRVENGLIVEMREYFNPLLGMKASGLPYTMPGWYATDPKKD